MALILPVIVVLCILAHGRDGAEHPDSVGSSPVPDQRADGAPACEFSRRHFRDLSVPEDEVAKAEDGEAVRDQ